MNVLDSFANIGKAVLTQAMGLQKNYSEVVEETIDIIDYNSTACSSCKHCALIKSFAPDSEPYATAVSACADCPNKTFTSQTITKKIYHNEKNRFGYKPRLKSNAIKLLLLFHFYHPDRFGIIKDLELHELATSLNCDIKTVKNNLEILAEYGYIAFCKTSPHIINLYLCDYDQYYLPANKGGRGFLVMSKELLTELLNLSNLLSLRIHLRQILEIDNLNAKGAFTAVSKTYKEIKLSLPEYCKPCIIRQAMGTTSNIFDITYKSDTHSIRFEIKGKFNCRQQKEECLNQYMLMLTDFIHDFNSTVAYINVNSDNPGKYNEFFYETPNTDKSGFAVNHMEQATLNRIRANGEFKLMAIKDFELEDLAQLALQYSFEYVLAALASIYKSYILKQRPIINLGGLLRTAIIALQENHITISKAA